MKSDRIYWKWFNVIWVCFFVGLATADIGEMPICVDVYPWYLPILILALLLPGLIASLLPDKDY